MLYSRKDIRDYWDKYSVFTPESLILNPFFVIFKTDYVSEAIVVAAVFMSELSLPVEDTSYDTKNGLLYMNYFGYAKIEEGKKLARDAMKFVMNAGEILSLNEDSCGLELFKQTETEHFTVI